MATEFFLEISIEDPAGVDLTGIQRVLGRRAIWCAETAPLDWVIKTTLPPSSWKAEISPYVHTGSEVSVRPILAKAA